MRRAGVFFAAVLIVVVFSPVFSETSEERQRVFVQNVTIQGNSSIDESSILRAAGLNQTRYYDFTEIRLAVERIEALYHEKGYTMARIVSAFFDLEGRLLIDIDEGRILSIRVQNNNVYQIYTIKSNLGIEEGDSFNEITLSESLEALKEKLNASRFSYTAEASELHDGQIIVYIRAETYSTRRFSYSLHAQWLKLIPGIGYEKAGFWGLDHEVKLFTGVEFEFWDIRSGTTRVEYYFPSFLGKRYRPWIKLQRDTRKVERERINIQYEEENITLGLYMQRRLGDKINLNMGFARNFFSVSEFGRINPSNPQLVTGFESETIPYNSIQAGLSLFDAEGHFRKDKALQADVSASLVFPDQSRAFLRFSAEAKKTFEFGFNDLYFRYGHWFHVPDSPFYFDIDAARSGLHGYPTDTYFTRSMFLLNTEYRISLYKDVLSLLLLLDMSLFRPVHYHEDGTADKKHFAFHSSFGEGLAFVWSEFSMRVFYAFPLRKEIREGRFHLAIRKVF